jgi:hypothetical protein
MIWIPKAAGHDFAAAADYGESRFIFDNTDAYFNPDRLYDVAEETLQEWRPGDRLLISGPAHMNAIVLMIIASKQRDVPLLIFHAREEKYVERVFHGRSDRRPAEPPHDVPSAADQG